MKLVKNETYPEMYYLQWPDGSMSDDFYNKSRANNFRRIFQERIDAGRADAGLRKPAGAFK